MHSVLIAFDYTCLPEAIPVFATLAWLDRSFSLVAGRPYIRYTTGTAR